MCFVFVLSLSLYLLWSGEVECDKKAQRDQTGLSGCLALQPACSEILHLTFLSFHFFPPPLSRGFLAISITFV